MKLREGEERDQQSDDFLPETNQTLSSSHEARMGNVGATALTVVISTHHT